MTEMTIDGVPDYHSAHMVAYKAPEDIGFTSLEMLPFLKGQPWDNLALGFVHALEPTSIRVTRGEMTCDARTGRVTVVVDENDIIEEITKEVAVGLYGWQHGAALQAELKSRLAGNPPQGPQPHDWSDQAFYYCPYVPQRVEVQYGLDCEDEITKALIEQIEAEKNG